MIRDENSHLRQLFASFFYRVVIILVIALRRQSKVFLQSKLNLTSNSDVKYKQFELNFIKRSTVTVGLIYFSIINYNFITKQHKYVYMYTYLHIKETPHI